MNYQKGIKINFISDTSKIDEGASFDLSTYVTDTNALMQDTLINAYLKRGSDKLNPTRGTDLIRDSRYYSVYSLDELIHIGNFAAADTKAYINDDILSYSPNSPYNTKDPSSQDVNSIEEMNESLLNNFTLKPNLSITNNVIYNAELSTTKGVVVGSDAIIPELLS
jgi:hypothetical protein